jgi:hypothetical protein
MTDECFRVNEICTMERHSGASFTSFHVENVLINIWERLQRENFLVHPLSPRFRYWRRRKLLSLIYYPSIHQFCHWKFTYHCFPLSNTFSRAFRKHLLMKILFLSLDEKNLLFRFVVAFFFVSWHLIFLPFKVNSWKKWQTLDSQSTECFIIFFNVHLNPIFRKTFPLL